jgi:AbrB family looped-hinge helix DNA binding protein
MQKVAGRGAMMGKSIRLRKKAQLTIPTDVIEQLHLSEGDQLDIRVENGRIILIPTVTIAKDQAWFWTESWQKGEQKADQDVKSGRLTDLSSEEELEEFFRTIHK